MQCVVSHDNLPNGARLNERGADVDGPQQSTANEKGETQGSGFSILAYRRSGEIGGKGGRRSIRHQHTWTLYSGR